MSKFFLFWILWILTGNPFIALVGPARYHLFPGQALHLNPHDTSDKQELAQLLMEKKRYREALPYLEEVLKAIPESAEIRAEIGLCHLKLGDLEQGEKMMLDALEQSPGVHYGEHHLRLGEAFSASEREKVQNNRLSPGGKYLYKKTKRDDREKLCRRERTARVSPLPKTSRRLPTTQPNSARWLGGLFDPIFKLSVAFFVAQKRVRRKYKGFLHTLPAHPYRAGLFNCCRC